MEAGASRNKLDLDDIDDDEDSLRSRVAERPEDDRVDDRRNGEADEEVVFDFSLLELFAAEISFKDHFLKSEATLLTLLLVRRPEVFRPMA